MHKIRKEFTLSINAVAKLRQEKRRRRNKALPKEKIWITESSIVDSFILANIK